MPPAGYKRSRALWDEARRPDATWRDWIRAILYEVQPLRFSNKANQKQLVQLIRRLIVGMVYIIQSLPGIAWAIVRFLRTRTRQHWLIVAGVLAYYYFVRWMHYLLDAGPLVIIATSLVLIFTIGLNDNANPGGISAYSVFNRGFERLLGSVDVDSLLAQHVGGGLGGAGFIGAPPAQADQEDRLPARAAIRRPAEVPVDNGDGRDDDDDDSVEDDDDGDAGPNQQNRARKSGKKARRRNLEHRQEIRRQREAAAAIGLQGGEGPQDVVAMQRLIEEQIAGENHEDNGN